jgi:hypothetical protein
LIKIMYIDKGLTTCGRKSSSHVLWNNKACWLKSCILIKVLPHAIEKDNQMHCETIELVDENRVY